MRKFQNNKGITLIALIITVIVLLILAGVTISLVVGDNGVLTQSKKASGLTQEKTAVEEVELAYSSLMSSYYAGYAENASLDKWAYVTEERLNSELSGNGSIVDGTFEKDDNTKEIEFVYSSNGKNKNYKIKITYDGRVERVSGLSIPGTLALQKEENVVGTATTIIAVKDGIEGEVTWSISPEGVATLSATTGDSIQVTPVAATTSSATITSTCSGESKQCVVNVAVLSKVAVTFKLNGGSLNSSTDDVVKNEFPGTEITLPVPTKTDYNFVGWYDNEQGTGNPAIPTNSTTIETPSSVATYWAKWREPKSAFRSYGEPVATDSVAGTYGVLGTQVQLNGGNPIAVPVGSQTTIQDNWKVFYEDDDFVYLIYGDYYPMNVQTSGESFVYIGLMESTLSRTYGIKSKYVADRNNILKYLRNNKSYTWSSDSSNDNFGTGGTAYTSWNNLRTALSETITLEGESLTIQGSPDMELWVKSWNAKGNTELKVTKESNGYNIMGVDENSNNNYYIRVKNNPYNSSANVDNHTGYYDELYFPYRVDQSTAYGYWLASPNALNTDCVCNVQYEGYLGRSFYGGNQAFSYYNWDLFCARPVVAIAKQ